MQTTVQRSVCKARNMNLSSLRVLLPLVAFALTSFAFQGHGHQLKKTHQHCGEAGVKCTREEDKVRGYWIVAPNSSPTPHTGGNSPTNSMSDSCEGSGCITYDASYIGNSCKLIDGSWGVYKQVGTTTTGKFKLRCFADNGSTPPQAGDTCTTGSGKQGVTSSHGACMADQDGDKIPDHQDDCPADPTNSDPYCLDDLTDCPTIYAATVDVLGASALTRFALRGGTTSITLVIGGAAVTTTVAAVVTWGAAALTFGTLYCVVAELEG